MRSSLSLRRLAVSTFWNQAQVRTSSATAGAHRLGGFWQGRRSAAPAALLAATLLASCGGDGDYRGPATPQEAAPSAATFTLGGSVSGLKGSGLVLQANAGQTLSIAADGPFVLPAPLAHGATYAVTVKSQPNSPVQTCTVANAGGTMGEADVSDLKVTCATSAFAISGSVRGLAGTGLVIQNNAADDLTLQADGRFAFAVKVASGAAYAVTVRSQPGAPAQTCTVGNAGGTVLNSDIADVAIVCATETYTIGGTVTGLTAPGLVLQNNASDDLLLPATGPFQFATAVAYGARYAVTVKTPPRFETCTVANGSAVATADVSDVTVSCVPARAQVTTLPVDPNMSINKPMGVATDASGNVYVADTDHQRILKLSANAGGGIDVTTLAGTGTSGWRDGPGADAMFRQPIGIAVDAKGIVYVADFHNLRVRKITPQPDGTVEVSTLAGSGISGGVDGVGTTASFTQPTDVAIDASGNVYVAEPNSSRIRKITPQPDGSVQVSTMAGTGLRGATDGAGATASFMFPVGVAADAKGNVYVSDMRNHNIRKITQRSDGSVTVTTLAGTGSPGWADGAGATSLFNGPSGVAVDAQGELYVADQSNNRIRRITQGADGSVVVRTLAGSGLSGAVDGFGAAASFTSPYAIAVGIQGHIYVTDLTNGLIRKITSVP